MAHARLHEFYASAGEGAAACGLAILLAAGIAEQGPILWLRAGKRRCRGAVPYAPGLAELGIQPGRLILAETRDVPALLRAAGDSARCGGLGALLVEAKGRAPELDLTASRRLRLAGERSGVTVLLVRTAVATPVPSAAETRWQVAAAPSRGLEEEPGQPAFIVELLRRRGGPAGARWRLEWNREQANFRSTALPGAMVPLPAGGAAADRAGAGRRGFRTAA